MQITSVTIWKTLNALPKEWGVAMSLNDVCVFVPSWFGVSASVFLGLLTCVPAPRRHARFPADQSSRTQTLCAAAHATAAPAPIPIKMAEPPLEPCSGSACLCSPPRLLCACAQERVLKLLERGRLLNAHHGHRPRPHHAVRPASGPPRVARPGTLVMAAARAAHPTEVASLLSSHAHMLSLMRTCSVSCCAQFRGRRL